jgi:hypothetical protein
MPAIHTRLASIRARLGSAAIGTSENAVSVIAYAKSAYRLIAIAYVMSNVMSFVFAISETAVLE